MKKIAIASDSYKGTLSSQQVADALEAGFLAADPSLEIVKIAVADGGEGTVDAIMSARDGVWVNCRTQDPLGRIIDTKYAMCGDTAVIEAASSSGLTLLAEDERNPTLTSSFGTGEQIADALSRGCRKFIIGIGGSATNDGGTGIMAALGAAFLDKNGSRLKPIGKSLNDICSIDLSGFSREALASEFSVICDVDSPLFGPKGAAYTFAAQKGASEQEIAILDDGLRNYGAVMEKTFGTEVCNLAGAGAAGGIGGALKAFLNGNLRQGVEVVLDAIDFDSRIEGADLVITGEGRLDFQTHTGKTPSGVLKRASGKGIPVIAVAGCVEHCESLDNMGFEAIYATNDIPNTVSRLKTIAEEIYYNSMPMQTPPRPMKA